MSSSPEINHSMNCSKTPRRRKLISSERVRTGMPGALVSQGDRVTLRTVEADDLGFVQRASANPEVRVPIGNPVRSRGRLEDAREDRDEGEGEGFLVCLEDDPDPGQPDEGSVERIGQVMVDDVSYRRPDLGYWLAPEYHGEGYGKAAVALVVEFVFRSYDHPAVGAVAYEFNDASRGLLESLGFEEEGRIRRDRFVDGEYVDTYVYGLLREDWRGAD
jgi:ribosomal-protein-alanine N-acetyltransferase